MLSEPIWRLTVGQYHEMIRNGILTEDDPLELSDGPTGQPDYHQRRDFRPGEEVPLLVEGCETGRIKVAEVLPGVT